MIEVRELELPGVYEILPPKFGDSRGFFSETWNRDALADAGIHVDFVQDNHSYSSAPGVLRGLHFQVEPFAQDKLVRVSKGSVYDVALDIRTGSATFGKWLGLTISAENWNQVLVPKGFAHGFVTMEPDTEVIYKVSAPYAPRHERSIRFDDPAIGIQWPFDPDQLTLSEKDRRAGMMAEVLAETVCG